MVPFRVPGPSRYKVHTMLHKNRQSKAPSSLLSPIPEVLELTISSVKTISKGKTSSHQWGYHLMVSILKLYNYIYTQLRGKMTRWDFASNQLNFPRKTKRKVVNKHANFEIDNDNTVRDRERERGRKREIGWNWPYHKIIFSNKLAARRRAEKLTRTRQRREGQVPGGRGRERRGYRSEFPTEKERRRSMEGA